MLPSGTVEVVPFREDLAHHFAALNREWIERYFVLEEADLTVFKDPHRTIVEPGGQIFFVISDDDVVGTCAVIRHDSRVYELAKMAVAPRAQGRGYSNLLAKAAIEFAQKAAAQTLMLLSNSRLGPALRLYEKHGFKYVPVSDAHEYSRVDLQMELTFGDLTVPPNEKIPESLKATIERVYGETGRQWLVTAPALLNECRMRWSLELDEPFANLSYNFVIPGRTSAGREIVLKVGVPCTELLAETAALSLFDGVGAVRLLDHDAARGMLLIERVTPGIPIYQLHGEVEATKSAAALMRRLWRVPPQQHSFPSLAIWFRAFSRLRDGFGGGTGPFPSEVIEEAEHQFSKLNASSTGNVILHGDLHHENILSSASDGWLAIDPKGICGDPGYEVGSFMLNQLPADASDAETMTILDQRLSIFSAELEIPRERLAGWAFCHAVLSALWNFEESTEWLSTIRLAEMLHRLTKYLI
jgi:streptomycin 6-kinase